MSTFTEWCDTQPHGILKRIAAESGISYGTVCNAYHGTPLRIRSARLLSAATGGAVSVESLRVGALAGEVDG